MVVKEAIENIVYYKSNTFKLPAIFGYLTTSINVVIINIVKNFGL